MGDGIVINADTVEQLGNDLLNETARLVAMVDNARAQVEETKQYYDAPAATAFRNKMNDFANNAKKGINENFGNLSDYFKTVASIYRQNDQSIKTAEDKYLNTDLFGAE